MFTGSPYIYRHIGYDDEVLEEIQTNAHRITIRIINTRISFTKGLMNSKLIFTESPHVTYLSAAHLPYDQNYSQ